VFAIGGLGTSTVAKVELVCAVVGNSAASVVKMHRRLGASTDRGPVGITVGTIGTDNLVTAQGTIIGCITLPAAEDSILPGSSLVSRISLRVTFRN
jgi:hypothetical protein